MTQLYFWKFCKKILQLRVQTRKGRYFLARKIGTFLEGKKGNLAMWLFK